MVTTGKALKVYLGRMGTTEGTAVDLTERNLAGDWTLNPVRPMRDRQPRGTNATRTATTGRERGPRTDWTATGRVDADRATAPLVMGTGNVSRTASDNQYRGDQADVHLGGEVLSLEAGGAGAITIASLPTFNEAGYIGNAFQSRALAIADASFTFDTLFYSDKTRAIDEAMQTVRDQVAIAVNCGFNWIWGAVRSPNFGVAALPGGSLLQVQGALSNDGDIAYGAGTASIAGPATTAAVTIPALAGFTTGLVAVVITGAADGETATAKLTQGNQDSSEFTLSNGVHIVTDAPSGFDELEADNAPGQAYSFRVLRGQLWQPSRCAVWEYPEGDVAGRAKRSSLDGWLVPTVNIGFGLVTTFGLDLRGNSALTQADV